MLFRILGVEFQTHPIINIKRNIIFALESRKKNGVPIVENVPIRMRVIYASQRIEFTTGYRIDVAKWDADKQRVKNGCTNKLKQSASEINADLLKYYAEIQNVFKEFKVQEAMPTTQQLKDAFNLRMKDANEEQQGETQISFWEVFDEFVKECGNQNNSMAIKSSIHIKPCNTKSSEAHNRRTAEYMRNIGESKIYIVSELSADNEQWVNPDFGNPNLQTHYDNIKRMVKEKTGRAMQEKERERNGKNGRIIKVAGCSPIREGVLLIRPDTTLADVRKFGEECQRRWGITPLQIFLHKDEGHWLNGQPEAEDKESFQIGSRWFKPNYHAHIVFDWMNHETGKSRKLNDNDMMEMQTLASDILFTERGQSKTITDKEHLERNDFIIKKQKAELQRIDETKRHRTTDKSCRTGT